MPESPASKRWRRQAEGYLRTVQQQTFRIAELEVALANCEAQVLASGAELPVSSSLHRLAELLVRYGEQDPELRDVLADALFRAQRASRLTMPLARHKHLKEVA